MTNLKGKLNVKQVENLTEAGRYNDGNGLYLFIKKQGGKSWVLRTRIRGKQTDLGLGGVAYVTLHEAREKAYELRKIARNGGDPRAAHNAIIPTFEELAKSVHEENLPTWKNPKHAAQWINTLTTYAFPVIGKKPVDQIYSSDVLNVLSPIWLEKQETARRVMQRIGMVFDKAKALRYREGENPVSEVAALKVLPKQKGKVKSHAAMPWKDVPEFYDRLCEKDATSALALRFTILTAARTSETLGANWDEIEDNTWVIPAERMKADNEHRVPLCNEALAILETIKGRTDYLLFEGNRRNQPMSLDTMRKLAKSLTDIPLTTHGFRSSFRDWAAEAAKARLEVAEAALAHTIQNKTQAAYTRTDSLDERRGLMERWGQYLTRSEAKVVRLSS